MESLDEEQKYEEMKTRFLAVSKKADKVCDVFDRKREAFVAAEERYLASARTPKDKRKYH
jgi:hypothetical protein